MQQKAPSRLEERLIVYGLNVIFILHSSLSDVAQLLIIRTYDTRRFFGIMTAYKRALLVGFASEPAVLITKINHPLHIQ
jgi:hypothetical protein